MKTRMISMIASIVLALPMGCSDDTTTGGDGGQQVDQGTDTQADQVGDGATTDQPTDTPGSDGAGRVPPPAACWHTQTGQAFVVEPLDADWADCISGCPNDTSAIPDFDLSSFTSDGLRGRIDGDDHAYSASGIAAGPDLDLIGLVAAPRTLVTIFVEPADGSQINPVVTTHDGFLAMTFAGEVVDGSRSARTQVVFPWATNIPFFFFIEEALNYENFPSTSFDYVGGAHEYTVRFETEAFAPTEMGALEAGTLLTATGELDCGGDVDYYRFTAGGNADVTLTVTRTGAEAQVLYVAAMDVTGGSQTEWQGRLYDGVQGNTADGLADGVVTLVASQFFDAGTGEYIFAVTDWNGAAGPGDFTYSVSVTLN